MWYLFAASLLWAPSFGLIGHMLAGTDRGFVAAARMLLSFLVFVPFLRMRAADGALIWRLAVLGAVQYGFMYVAYIHSFRYLPSHQVALFTIFTPVCVTLLSDLTERRFRPVFLLTAALAVLGTGVVMGAGARWSAAWKGWVLVQASNVCFAAGQVGYRWVMRRRAPAGAGWREEAGVFGWMYLGAALVTALWTGISLGGRVPAVSRGEAWTLLYLGIVPSGIAFFLWNRGATRTNTGALAVFNNVKVPLAVLCSLLLFGEKADGLRLLIGGAIVLAALVVNETYSRRSNAGGAGAKPRVPEGCA